jgi:NADH-quinone oxidoreductase subunit N
VASYSLLIPEFLLVVGAMLALFAELLPGRDRSAAWIGVAVTLAAAVFAALPADAALAPFGGLLAFDGPARFARVTVALLGAVWMLWTAGRGEGRVREAVSLALFSLLGCMLMAEARELITLLMSIELATIPAYVLVGYRRSDSKSLEAAIKYFLLSVLTTLVMLYGFSFVYGLSGSTRYGAIDLKGAGVLGLVAIMLALVGMFAKLSAAPFHFWAPDAYAGSSPWSVAFVSTVPKVAGAVAMVRFVGAVAPSVETTGIVLGVVAGASMLLGNLAALTQTDMRRLMAYSGVAHTGYLLIGVAALSRLGFTSAVAYSMAYAFPSMAIMLIAAEEGVLVSDFGGLAQRRPGVAWGLVIMLLSLVGVPPMIGFFGKFNLLIAGQQAGLTALVVIAVIVSVVSAGYYMRIVRTMFFAEAPSTARGQRRSPAATIAFAACVAATVGAGLWAGAVYSAIGTFLR